MSKNKKVIYTSIVGGYDTLIQPTVIDTSFDYICFVEKGKKIVNQNGAWQIEEILFDNSDSRLLSRYPKLLPHKILSQYEYSLWIDGNVSINDYRLYEIIDEKISNGILYSGLKHWGRDCAYDEAVGIANKVKEPFLSLVETILFLKGQHFPKHFGLYENNVILRKHNDSTIVGFDNMWWSLFCQHAKRDQLCHPFCYRFWGLTFDYLLPEDYCTRNHDYFIHVAHRLQPIEKNGCSKILYDVKRKVNVLILELILLF